MDIGFPNIRGGEVDMFLSPIASIYAIPSLIELSDKSGILLVKALQGYLVGSPKSWRRLIFRIRLFINSETLFTCNSLNHRLRDHLGFFLL